MVLVVYADRGCGARKREHRARERTAKEEIEVNNSANLGDGDAVVWNGENVEDETRLLVSKSRIWQQPSTLASEHSLPALRRK